MLKAALDGKHLHSFVASDLSMTIAKLNEITQAKFTANFDESNAAHHLEARRYANAGIGYDCSGLTHFTGASYGDPPAKELFCWETLPKITFP